MSAIFALPRTLRPALALAASLALVPAASTAEPEDDKKEDKEKKGASKDDYTIDTSGSSEKIKVKGKGELVIHIRPDEGLKVHPQAPLEVRLTPTDGVKPAKRKLGRKDVTDKEAIDPELTCDLRGEATGDHAVQAEVSFFLCSDTWCQRMTDKVTVPVKVTGN